MYKDRKDGGEKSGESQERKERKKRPRWVRWVRDRETEGDRAIILTNSLRALVKGG